MYQLGEKFFEKYRIYFVTFRLPSMENYSSEICVFNQYAFKYSFVSSTFEHSTGTFVTYCLVVT